MPESTPSRPFEQRIIDGFERSRIRHEVLKAKGNWISGLGRRYATLVLGASLAVGGLGIPLKASKMLDTTSDSATTQSIDQNEPLSREISGDLRAAAGLAREVSEGVNAAARTVTDPLSPQAAGRGLSVVTEKVKEDFFRTEVPFGTIIYNAARENHLAPELLAAVVKTESQFNPAARSHQGAQGLMQLVPKTGRWMGATNLMNPSDNVKAGARYLRYLNDQFNGDQTKIVAAYNAGEGNVRKFGGVPPFRETQKYVDRVLGSTQDFKDQMSGKMAELTQPGR
jgi:soluble lytic murein transglycosylase-like protein